MCDVTSHVEDKYVQQKIAPSLLVAPAGRAPRLLEPATSLLLLLLLGEKAKQRGQSPQTRQ